MSRNEKIEQLAQTNPIVRNCIQMQRTPGVLYEDALEMAVIALAEQNAVLTADLTSIRIRGLPPTIVVTSQEQADQLRAQCDSGEHPMPVYADKEINRFLNQARRKVFAITKANRPYIDRAEEHARAYAEAMYDVAAITDVERETLLEDAREAALARVREFKAAEQACEKSGIEVRTL